MTPISLASASSLAGASPAAGVLGPELGPPPRPRPPRGPLLPRPPRLPRPRAGRALRAAWALRCACNSSVLALVTSSGNFSSGTTAVFLIKSLRAFLFSSLDWSISSSSAFLRLARSSSESVVASVSILYSSELSGMCLPLDLCISSSDSVLGISV